MKNNNEFITREYVESLLPEDIDESVEQVKKSMNWSEDGIYPNYAEGYVTIGIIIFTLLCVVVTMILADIPTGVN